MRILIYGAGVIGSLYAVMLSEAGFDISVYARGKRLESLTEHGLRYKKDNKVRTAKVNVLSRLEESDCYDFVLLTVWGNQLLTALWELKSNMSPTIVTMVNSLDTRDRWDAVCGPGRILPAFPGAGGGFNGDVLDAALTPRIIQPTTIGRTDGREKQLAAMFKLAKIPCQIVDDMHAWQICHLGMVVPIADAYYESGDSKNVGRDRDLMRKTARQIINNFRDIREKGYSLSSPKMNLFRILSTPILAAVLGIVFRSRFGDRFMYQHSMKAPDEMRLLHQQLYNFIGTEI